MKAIALLTEFPDGLFGKCHRRWHRVEAIKLVKDPDTARYVLHVTYDLGRSVHADAQVLFDEMDREAA